MSNPDAGIEPIERKAGKAKDRAWQVRGLVLPVAGRWRVRIDVLLGDFEKKIFEDDIEIRP